MTIPCSPVRNAPSHRNNYAFHIQVQNKAEICWALVSFANGIEGCTDVGVFITESWVFITPEFVYEEHANKALALMKDRFGLKVE